MNPIYPKVRKSPSQREIMRPLPVKTNSSMRQLAPKRINNCLFIIGSKGNGVMRALIPSTMKMFMMLEPNTLPMAMPEFFFIAATTEVMSSGREVAVAQASQLRVGGVRADRHCQTLPA